MFGKPIKSKPMQKIRKQLKWLLPVLAVFMIGALLLSRVVQPDTDRRGAAQHSISPEQAAEYEGRFVEVCGEVVQATHATQIGGSPVFLNFGDAHPNQVLTVVIWQRFHSLWPQAPHRIFDGQFICATGDIEIHDGTPQIEIRHPGRIQIAQR